MTDGVSQERRINSRGISINFVPRPVVGRLVCRPTTVLYRRSERKHAIRRISRCEWRRRRRRIGTLSSFSSFHPCEIRSKRIENQRWIVVETEPAYFSFPFSTPSPSPPPVIITVAPLRGRLDLRHWREFRQFTTFRWKNGTRRERGGEKGRGWKERRWIPSLLLPGNDND